MSAQVAPWRFMRRACWNSFIDHDMHLAIRMLHGVEMPLCAFLDYPFTRLTLDSGPFGSQKCQSTEHVVVRTRLPPNIGDTAYVPKFFGRQRPSNAGARGLDPRPADQSYLAAPMTSLISARKPSAAGLCRPRLFFPTFSMASLMMSWMTSAIRSLS
jgi:hypothetical protein